MYCDCIYIVLGHRKLNGGKIRLPLIIHFIFPQWSLSFPVHFVAWQIFLHSFRCNFVLFSYFLLWLNGCAYLSGRHKITNLCRQHTKQLKILTKMSTIKRIENVERKKLDDTTTFFEHCLLHRHNSFLQKAKDSNTFGPSILEWCRYTSYAE